MILISILMIVMILCLGGIAVWVVIKNAEADERYERELDRIYNRKRPK